MKSCPCGCNRVIFLRNDISELEFAAEWFEQDNGILREVHEKFQLVDDFLHSNLSAYTEDDGYRPYCKIEFKSGSASSERVKWNSHYLDYTSQRDRLNSVAQESLSSAGSTLSSRGPDERLLQNVRFYYAFICYCFDAKTDLVYVML